MYLSKELLAFLFIILYSIQSFAQPDPNEPTLDPAFADIVPDCCEYPSFGTPSLLDFTWHQGYSGSPCLASSSMKYAAKMRFVNDDGTEECQVFYDASERGTDRIDFKWDGKFPSGTSGVMYMTVVAYKNGVKDGCHVNEGDYDCSSKFVSIRATPYMPFRI